MEASHNEQVVPEEMDLVYPTGQGAAWVGMSLQRPQHGWGMGRPGVEADSDLSTAVLE